jgi:hypothetical protein
MYLAAWRRGTNNCALKILLAIQTGYFFLTGIWPLLHINSFMAVTGKKKDFWLVKMVGLLTVAISITLFSGFFQPLQLPVIICAVTTASAYAAIDLYYTGRGVIPGIYLLDGVMQLLFISAWVVLACTGRGYSA